MNIHWLLVDKDVALKLFLTYDCSTMTYFRILDMIYISTRSIHSTAVCYVQFMGLTRRYIVLGNILIAHFLPISDFLRSPHVHPFQSGTLTHIKDHRSK